VTAGFNLDSKQLTLVQSFIVILRNTHDLGEINNTNDDELEVHYLSSYIPPLHFFNVYAMKQSGLFSLSPAML